MSLQSKWFHRKLATVLVALSFAPSSALYAVEIDDYRYQETVTLPTPGPGSFGRVLLDTLPDGRLLLLNGAEVLAETSVQSRTFSSIGSIPTFTPGYTPSFLAVSPDGTRAAAGTNNFGNSEVYVFSTTNPTSYTSYDIEEFTGDWIDNERLAIAVSSNLVILDTTSSSVSTVIGNIGGASAGVTIDSSGNLYTGNGFDFAAGGSDMGWIKAFSPADWQNALATSTPLDFEQDGIPIADLLSGHPIGFDASGNMFVGGADFFGGSGDLGFAALVDADAVTSALAGSQTSPPITASSPASVLRKFASPQSTIDAFLPPAWTYNAAIGELYLSYGDGSVYVYAVPEPCTIVLLVMASLLVSVRRVR